MMKVLKTIRVLVFAAMVAVYMVSVPACSEKKKEETASKKTGQELPKRKLSGESPGMDGESTKITGTQIEKVEEPVYSYSKIRSDGQPKRDPFTPIEVVGVSPIRTFDVSQLGVNGVIMHGIKKANIVTPNCKSAEALIGDPIGIHEGRVVDITLEGVLVRETYLDMKGHIQEYERFIKNRPYRCK